MGKMNCIVLLMKVLAKIISFTVKVAGTYKNYQGIFIYLSLFLAYRAKYKWLSTERNGRVKRFPKNNTCNVVKIGDLIETNKIVRL